MIKVQQIESLDGHKIDTSKMVIFEDGKIKNGLKRDLTFAESSGLNIVRLSGDQSFEFQNEAIKNGIINTIKQEENENPFVKILPNILLQPGTETTPIPQIRFCVYVIEEADNVDSNNDGKFIEYLPISVSNNKLIYPEIEINTSTFKFKILGKDDDIANLANTTVDMWSY